MLPEIKARENKNIGIMMITKAILNSFVVMYLEKATKRNGIRGREYRNKSRWATKMIEMKNIPTKAAMASLFCFISSSKASAPAR